MTKLAYIGIVTILLLSCNRRHEFHTTDEMFKWINDPSNGLVKTYENNNVKVTVKYLPPEYLAWQQVTDEEMNIEKWDSLMTAHKKNRVFLMVVAPGEKAKGDILYKDLTSIEGFKSRTMSMNFDMASYVEIEADKEHYKPVLATLENTYSATESRNIYMVFTDETASKKLLNEAELDFTFNDEIFNTGVNHFLYKKKDLDNIPEIAFLK